MSNPDSNNLKLALMRAIDNPLKFYFLLIGVVDSSMLIAAIAVKDPSTRYLLIGGAIILLMAIIIVVGIKSNFQKSLVEKIDEGVFEVHDDLGVPDQIWKDFRKDFKSFNDPWVMESNSPYEYLVAHKERYNDPKCGMFRFLFFIRDSSDQFERFVKFQAMVHLEMTESELDSNNFDSLLREKIEDKDLPKTLDSIKVYLNKESSPHQTFFIGIKTLGEDESEIQRVSIWYLSIVSEKSRPHLILKSTDNDFWWDLDRKWESSRTGSERVLGPDIFNKYLQISKLNKKV